MASIADIKQRRASTLARLVACAVAGERCPTSDQELRSDDVSALAHAGKILVEISSRNWRQVTIMAGPHKGAATAPNPKKLAVVYLTIDASGTRRRNGKLVSTSANPVTGMNQPSKPRLIPYVGKP